MAVSVPGSTDSVSVIVRDERFEAAADAEVTLTLTTPGGQSRTLTPTLSEPREGRYGAAARFDEAGVYRLEAEARKGERTLGVATRYVLVGGADLEMIDPRLNEPVLQRVADATGGTYLRTDEVARLGGMLAETEAGPQATEVRDLWHNLWTLLGIMAILAAEWVVRRRVGLA
jgi:hypothetical protein